jgi:nucleoside-diphosphate-sugar epimerase
VALAVRLALEQHAGGVFNVASGTSVSNLELARACIRVCRSSSTIELVEHNAAEDDVSWQVSIEKARSRLGYSPAYSLEESLRFLLESA